MYMCFASGTVSIACDQALLLWELENYDSFLRAREREGVDSRLQ